MDLLYADIQIQNADTDHNQSSLYNEHIHTSYLRGSNASFPCDLTGYFETSPSIPTNRQGETIDFLIAI